MKNTRDAGGTGSAGAAGPAGCRRAPSSIGSTILKRASLGLGSLVLVGLTLELIVRVCVTPLSPWSVREGVFHHSLPVGSGFATALPEPPEGSYPLPEEPRGDELRVFVFGESSVRGTPWSLAISAPAMLRDMLASRFPGRRVSVVNMGRSGAMTIDSYYYLVAAARFEPDVIVFYQGTNDEYDVGFEICLPGTHPRLHAVWRWMVERSRLLWAVRALGPAWVRSFAGGGRELGDFARPWEGERCPKGAVFRAWTRVLVDRALGTGAQVIVAGPTRSDVSGLEYSQMRAHRGRDLGTVVDELPAIYRRTVLCALQRTCRLGELYEELVDLQARTAPGEDGEDGEAGARDGDGAHDEDGAHDADGAHVTQDLLEDLVTDPEIVAELATIWKETAAERGVAFIDFDALLRQRVGGGPLLVAPMFSDTVHLTVEGYWLLAYAWAQTAAALVDHTQLPADQLEARAPPELSAAAIPRPETAEYISLMDAEGESSYCEALLDHGARFIEPGALLVGISLLETAREACGAEGAATMLAWLRRRLGVPEALSPQRALELDALDVHDLLRSLKSGPH